MRRLLQRIRRAFALRSDVDDLYRTMHAQRLRLNTTEAMVVALAWAHPDSHALLDRIHEWMAMPSGESLTDFLRDIQRSEHDRVTSHWQSLIQGAPSGAPARSRVN